MMYSDCQIDDG